MHLLLPARGNDQRDAGAHGDLRRLNLRRHAADGGGAVRAARGPFQRFVHALDEGDRLGVGLAEVLQHAVHGGQNDQQIRRQQRRDQRGELVVVAEFQFGERDDVVLVDDRDDAVAEQRDQRVAGVEMAFVMFQVVVREQDLGDGQAVRAEELLVDRHEPRLADRGAGLQFGQVARALFVAQRAHARADGARGDQHDFSARLALLGDLRHQLLHLGKVRLLPAVGQDAGAELHHHARDIFE